MLDFQGDMAEADDAELVFASPRTGKTPYWRSGGKTWFDRCGAFILLLPLVVAVLLLMILNPFFNRGPLLFVQDRMGYRCRRFTAFKFRTMSSQPQPTRGAFDALETDRITVLGHLMRKARIDELPQVLNVLRGEMSLIGPRPDSYEHARVYLQAIPGYRARHNITPGISGFAQVKVGYVDGMDGVRHKVAADLHYAAHACVWFDLWITWRTLVVILTRRGA